MYVCTIKKNLYSAVIRSSKRLIGCKSYLNSTVLVEFKPRGDLNSIQLYRRKYTDPQIFYTMNEVFLRYEKGNNEFEVSFRFVNNDLRIDRQFNFNRRTSETVNSFLKRIENRIQSLLVKRKGKKKTDTSMLEQFEEILTQDNVKNNKIALFKNDEIIDGDVSCETIFDDMAALRLVVFDSTYTINWNAPNIKSISLPNSILAGFPTYPAKFETEFMDLTKSDFEWYKNDPRMLKKPVWNTVGKGYLYIPDVSDIGSRLKLTCIPRNDRLTGPTVSVESKNPVEAGPGECPFETRHQFTKDKLSGKSFRVVSYNLLADTYADSDYSRETLFPYCPPYALKIDYRKQLLLKELIGFNSDMFCLQEVDSKIYKSDLLPSLKVLGYDGVFITKNEVNEGLATFFRKDRFEILNSEHIVIGHNTNFQAFSDVWNKIQNEKMKERFLQRNTTLQVTTLKSSENPQEILIVGNTHLYFHPDADHIRLLQGYYVLTFMRHVLQRTQEQYPEHNVSVILCGDFNSVPECGIYQLMTENYVPENCKDWSSNSEEAVTDVSLSSDLKLFSACGTPQYTNYTPEFSGCLDYIFYQSNRLTVEQVIPMPSTEEVTAHIGLPSVVFPSDHISLCADLKFS